MAAKTLWVPFSVLYAPSPSAGTRLIWLLHCLHSGRDATEDRLQVLSGLHRKSIAQARARLARAPLASCSARPQRDSAAMPVALLADASLSAGARLLYGQLQGVPNFGRQAGSFTYASLSHLTRRTDDTLRQAVAELAAANWLTVTQKNRSSPLQFTLQDPVATKVRARISSVRRRVRGALHRGEALLREFLTVMVALNDYEEDASPDILLNPYTRELMELDRLYPAAAVAFEFNGAQHFQETDLATFAETVKQVGRDAMKAFICQARGIDLVVIHPEDLSLKAIEQKIPGRLPRRALEGMEPLVAELEALAAEYRQRTADERARTAPRSGRH